MTSGLAKIEDSNENCNNLDIVDTTVVSVNINFRELRSSGKHMWTGKEIKYLSLLPELLICFGLNKLLIMQKEMGASLQALPRGYCVCLCGHFLPHKPSLAYKELFSRNMNESKVV